MVGRREPENPTVIAAEPIDTLLDQPPFPRATRPRPRSPAQAEASRRNGAKSRGPRTAQGKAESRRNALRHGLFASTLRPAPGPDYAHSDYDELLKGLMDEHRPTTRPRRSSSRRSPPTCFICQGPAVA